MPVALADFECMYDGERVEILAGITHMHPSHELVRRFPANFAPEGKRRRRRRFGTRNSSQPAQARPVFDPSSHDVQRSARHEAGRVVAGFLLGWSITGAELHADGGGDCRLLAPNHGRSLRLQEFAIICFATSAHVGWTAEDDYRGNRRQAYKALQSLRSDPRELAAAVRQEAKQLAASPRFRWLSKWLCEELLERGQLDATELGPLLLKADRSYRRSSYAD